MDQKNKAKFFTFLYIFLIIALILFLLWIVFWLEGISKQCLDDPIKYFENRMEGSHCLCYDKNFNLIMVGNRYNPKTILINNQNTTIYNED